MIDPIVVREERERMESYKRTMLMGLEAADALLWFKEYADKAKPETVVTIYAELVATLTPNAKIAQSYIANAAKNYAEDILKDAIDQARYQFDVAEQLRKKSSR